MNELSREEDDDPSNIRNYLASFHKEIDAGDIEETDSFIEQDSEDECGTAKVIYRYFSDNELDEDDQNIIHIKAEPDDDDDDDETDFYTSFNFHGDKEPNFLKAKVLSNIGTVLRTDSKGELIEDLNDDLSNGAIEDSAVIPAIGETLNIDDPRTLQMVAKFAEQAVAKAKNSDPDADNSYQTVTIVPSDTNPGELSYVLFVSKDNSLNQVVYDLHDPAQLSSALLTKGIERNRGKVRALRLGHPQLVTPEHLCPYCSYRSPKKYLLSRHLKSHSDDRPHKCGVCERGFKTVASLQNHVNTHTGTRPHPCKDCDSCFTTSGELVRHVRYKHTHERPHKCTECDYASVELSKLKRHLRCHTGERPYQCPHCTYASPDTYKLKRHLRIHTGEKPYECDICQTRFTQSNSLKAHKLIHSRNKPIFRCEYCPTTCGRKTDLRIHMEKLHSSDNPHRCKRCSKVFLDRYSYKIHVKSHDGEKCYKCDLCSYASTSHRHLETHMLVHTDEKPFVCDACDMSFRQKQLLKRHKNLYHDPNYVRPEPKEKTHVCDVCFKAFRHKGNLLRHLVVHDPDASMSDHEAALSLGASTEVEGLSYEDEKDDQKNQEVVVFEVIQLPPSRGSAPQPTLAVVDGNSLSVDGESQLFSIIEPADEEDFQFPTDTVTLAKSITKNTKEASLKNCVVHAQKSKKVTHSKKLPRLLKVSAAKDAPSPEKLLLPKEKELSQTELEDVVESFSFTEREEDLLISTSDYQEFAENLEGLS